MWANKSEKKMNDYCICRDTYRVVLKLHYFQVLFGKLQPYQRFNFTELNQSVDERSGYTFYQYFLYRHSKATFFELYFMVKIIKPVTKNKRLILKYA